MRILVFGLALFFMLFSCKKNGTDGDATLVVFPEHQGRLIKGCTLYVKYDAKSSEAYELRIAGGPGDDRLKIKGLRPGDYFIDGVGYDDQMSTPVYGKIHAVIKWKDRKKETNITMSLR